MKGKSTWNALRQALPIISLGWDLALPIFGGVLAGYYADQWLGTGPILTLGLLLFGIAVGFYNVIRAAQRLEGDETNVGDKKGTD